MNQYIFTHMIIYHICEHTCMYVLCVYLNELAHPTKVCTCVCVCENRTEIFGSNF